VIVKRIGGRRVCAACGATFHTQSKPPKKDGICDLCGAELSIRKDDNPETVVNRLHIYHEQTEPLKEYYKKTGKYAEIDGTRDINVITNDILGILKG
jgi:adenylate kinase